MAVRPGATARRPRRMTSEGVAGAPIAPTMGHAVTPRPCPPAALCRPVHLGGDAVAAVGDFRPRRRGRAPVQRGRGLERLVRLGAVRVQLRLAHPGAGLAPGQPARLRAAGGDDRQRGGPELLQQYRPGRAAADGRGVRVAVAAAAAGEHRRAGGQRAAGGAGLRARDRLLAARSGDAVDALRRLQLLRVRHRLRGPAAGAGPRRATPAERRAARHPRAAGRKRARERAHPHLPRTARPAGPPPHRAEPEPGGGQPPGQRAGAGARRPGPYPGQAAAERRARGGEPAARRRRHRHAGHPAAAGRQRARPAHRHGHAADLPGR